MSNSVRPHRQQPTRLPRPWDSPGKNTGVGCHFLLECMKMKSESEAAQSCPTLRDPSFSNAWKWKVKVKPLSPVQLFETPGTAAYQAPPSMRFSRQEYWSGVPTLSLIMFARFSSLNEYRSFIVTAVQFPIIWVYPDHLASPTLINPWVVSDISELCAHEWDLL